MCELTHAKCTSEGLVVEGSNLSLPVQVRLPSGLLYILYRVPHSDSRVVVPRTMLRGDLTGASVTLQGSNSIEILG